MFSNVFHKFIQPCSAPPRNLYEHMTLWCNVSHKCFNLLTNLTKQKNNPCHYTARWSSGKSLLGHSDYFLLGVYFAIQTVSTEMATSHVFLVAEAGKFEVNMFGPIAI